MAKFHATRSCTYRQQASAAEVGIIDARNCVRPALAMHHTTRPYVYCQQASADELASMDVVGGSQPRLVKVCASRVPAYQHQASATQWSGSALPRKFHVNQCRPAQIFQGPSSAEPMPAVVQRPGAAVFTTGRVNGAWVEVHNAHLRTGWMPFSSLTPSVDAGHHGDHLESKGGTASVLRAHQQAMLQVSLKPGQAPRCNVVTQAGGQIFEIRNARRRAHICPPEFCNGEERLPLMLALHGSRPLDHDLAEYTRFFAQLLDSSGVLLVVPESADGTWDFLLTGQRDDMDFIEFVLNEARRVWPVDDRRLGVLGHSDGASLALSMVLRNPHIFQAALVVATGFFVEPLMQQRCNIFMEYGTRDHLFGFETVALPNRDRLLAAGHNVDFRGIEEAGHALRPEFVLEALHFWLSLPPLQVDGHSP